MSPTLDDLIDTLRSRGERITIPRRSTLKALLGAHAHLTIEQIHEQLVEEGIRVDEATIYRSLQWLKDNDLVAQTDMGQGADVYCLVDANHHHLICLNCGRVIEADETVFACLQEELVKKYRFVPRIEHLAIFGLCSDCQDGQPGP